MREYIADRRQAPLLLTGSWILIGKSDDGKKIRDLLVRCLSEPVERGGNVSWRGRWNPDSDWNLTPTTARLAPHGDFAQVKALRRIGCES